MCLTYEGLEKEVILDAELEGCDFLQCQISVYCPKVFKMLQQSDKTINIYQSFSVQNNKQLVTDFAGPSGGKSGEFFFFTSDNKLLMKTITTREL
jgi:1-phosphatidylinositol-4-phosphate 5-kinase